jgi:toxin FitB
MVLDTNILIYSTKPGGERLRPWLDDPGAVVSIASRIEALGYPHITPEERRALEAALQLLPEIQLTEAVATGAIALRQQRRMSLADAIIAATALAHALPLVTQRFQAHHWLATDQSVRARLISRAVAPRGDPRPPRRILANSRTRKTLLPSCFAH